MLQAVQWILHRRKIIQRKNTESLIQAIIIILPHPGVLPGAQLSATDAGGAVLAQHHTESIGQHDVRAALALASGFVGGIILPVAMMRVDAQAVVTPVAVLQCGVGDWAICCCPGDVVGSELSFHSCSILEQLHSH